MRTQTRALQMVAAAVSRAVRPDLSLQGREHTSQLHQGHALHVASQDTGATPVQIPAFPLNLAPNAATQAIGSQTFPNPSKPRLILFLVSATPNTAIKEH